MVGNQGKGRKKAKEGWCDKSEGSGANFTPN